MNLENTKSVIEVAEAAEVNDYLQLGWVLINQYVIDVGELRQPSQRIQGNKVINISWTLLPDQKELRVECHFEWVFDESIQTSMHVQSSAENLVTAKGMSNKIQFRNSPATAYQ
jgi:hypothetical protein